MTQSKEWIPTTLVEMAAFCEKNNLAKAQSILLEAAALVYINFASEQSVNPPNDPESKIFPPQCKMEEVIDFRRNGTEM